MAAAEVPTAVVLARRQLYILPTAGGLVFSLLLVVLLLAAVNYTNSLAYGLCFLLAAIAIVSMLDTHRNLHGLHVSLGPSTPVFAGNPAGFEVCLDNSSESARFGVCVERDRTEVRRVDLRAGEQRYVRIDVPTRRRGYVTAPALVISTRFPLGFLYAWSRRIQLPQRCFVYPQPAPPGPMPVAPDEQFAQDQNPRAEGEDFVGLREFRPGDSPRHVSWRAVARGQGMLTKQFGGGGRASLWLDWDTLAGLDAEYRLSQLCRWVLDCEHAGLRYGLRLPDTQIAPAQGEAHRRRCLTALALFPSR